MGRGGTQLDSIDCVQAGGGGGTGEWGRGAIGERERGGMGSWGDGGEGGEGRKVRVCTTRGRREYTSGCARGRLVPAHISKLGDEKGYENVKKEIKGN